MKNNQGQIFVEVCIILSLIALVTFAAFSQFSSIHKYQGKFKFTKENHHGRKTRSSR